MNIILPNVTFQVIIIAMLWLSGCKPTEKIASYTPTQQTKKASVPSRPSSSRSASRPKTESYNDYRAEGNNLIVSKDINTSSASGAGDTFIFEGENNIVEIISTNSAFFDQGHDVIVIKGDNNHIKIYNTNVVDLMDVDSNTYTIFGDNEKYVYYYEGEPKLTKDDPEYTYATLGTPTPAPNISMLKDEIDEDCDCWPFFEEYETQINDGKLDGYFNMAELYDLGKFNAPTNAEKALELYEYAAAKGHVPSIRKLGDIWYNGGFDYDQDRTKALYYFKLGASLGDEYCIHRLAKIQ